jgi:beta-N-acetylhexosaminidase
MSAAGPPQGTRPPGGAAQSAVRGDHASQVELPRGPVVLGIEGCELTAADRTRLVHPLVGGVILFARNFASCAQLCALTASIRELRAPAPLICVDHEGGRVQRFREGFTAIPPMRTLGEWWDRDVAGAAQEARRLGHLMATELRAHGVDFSFAPVLDLDFGASAVIGNRAFHANPNAAAHLASCLRRGLNAGGCAAVGKHFPGHGFVAADSHVDLPVDERTLDALLADDLVPFAALAHEGLEAVMPAHVVYPAVDPAPAGYSRVWLQDILRGRLAFDGLIFSDDLEMAGAVAVGDIVARAEAAVVAGCDMVLTCNDFAAADRLLAAWRPPAQPELARRTAQMAGK